MDIDDRCSRIGIVLRESSLIKREIIIVFKKEYKIQITITVANFFYM